MGEDEQIKRLLKLISLNDDQSAYKQLFVLLYHRLKQFAYSILKSNEEAEELVSDVFVRIWDKRAQLISVESPRLYLYTITKNLAFTRISRQRKQINITSEEWFVQLDSIYFDPEQLVITEEILRQIRKAVNDLPPRCKLIFKLIKEDGLKYKEVAELLQLSIKTVEAQMAIALRRIGKCMHFEIKSTPFQVSSKKS
ncbi:MAG: RNA polymerase sigma-70 factor [Sphingobacteriales bacterium]|nr:RNA polymerase sigma-70 factor [Sphingobacteriales bacterium]